MDELVDQFMAYFAHWSEEAQPKIFRGHFAEKIGIEGSILRHELADQNGVPSEVKCCSFNVTPTWEPTSPRGCMRDASTQKDNFEIMRGYRSCSTTRPSQRDPAWRDGNHRHDSGAPCEQNCTEMH